MQPVLRVPGVLIVGSEVPNLLDPDVASTLVVSQDVDIAVPVERHEEVKARLGELRGLVRAAEEPSVWLPQEAGFIEVNFIGMDARLNAEVLHAGSLALIPHPGVEKGQRPSTP